MRDAYLNAIERAGLRDLVDKWRVLPLIDCDIAAVPSLRDDGAAVLVKLTIERVEQYAAQYWDKGWSENFTFPGEQP